jgi:hypothetical protein
MIPAEFDAVLEFIYRHAAKATPPPPIRRRTNSMDDLTERRARFVYEGARIAAVAAKAPIIPEPWDDRGEDFRSQFCEVIERQCGPMRSSSPAELHGGWVQAYIDMGWTYGSERDVEKKTHPDMVPYDQLGQLEQDKDSVFVALCEIARLWVYDLAPEAPETKGPQRDCDL